MWIRDKPYSLYYFATTGPKHQGNELKKDKSVRETKDGKYSINIYVDDDNLYIALEGKPDNSFYVEIGGYLGEKDKNIKKADESMGLTSDDIERLKALGYIQ